MTNNSLAQYQLVIFDWDGTLMDSIAKIVSSLQTAAINCGFAIPHEDAVKKIIGLSLPQAFEVLFPDNNGAHNEALVTQYKLQYRELNTTPSPLFRHAKELLTHLNNQNRLLAVATGKGRLGLQRVFDESDTEHFFHGSRCSDEHASKPNPDMIHSLLDEFNIEPHRAIMIGDSVHDMAMAENAGIERVGVTLGVDSREILHSYQPKAIVDTLEELKNLFN